MTFGEPAPAASAVIPGIDLPPRSLVLDRPVWGIDPATTRVAFGILHGQGRVEWSTCSLPPAKTDPGLRFSGALRTIATRVRELVQLYGDPEVVYLEEPFGGGGEGKARTVHPSSQRMLGVVMAAVGYSTRAPVVLVQPNVWKKAAMGAGKGNAKPPAYLEWAQQVAGYSGALEDEAAAIGIATAAAVLGR